MNFVDLDGLEPKSFPNQRYNPVKTTPKVTPPVTPKYQPTPAPKITPKNYNPNGINNLPGKGISDSPNVSKTAKGISGTFRAINNISKLLGILGNGAAGAPIIIMINPDMYMNRSLDPCNPDGLPDA